MRLVEPEGGQVIAARLELADNEWKRFIGLMGRPSIAAGDGLLLDPCNSIHMFFMRFPIDVLFLDKENRVKKVLLRLKPWRLSPIVFGARKVVELPAGTLTDKALEGRRLEIG
jgi:uncharacterized membrane protein (UPF0127 family)